MRGKCGDGEVQRTRVTCLLVALVRQIPLLGVDIHSNVPVVNVDMLSRICPLVLSLLPELAVQLLKRSSFCAPARVFWLLVE